MNLKEKSTMKLQNRKRKMKGNLIISTNNLVSGITLIALVVTIVVLLILAGITIGVIFSDNGVIKKAQEAANVQNQAIEKDKQEINDLLEDMETIKWDFKKVNKVISADNVRVPVPKGFVASEATGEKSVKTGFVIYQGEETVNDSNVGTARTSRNQFVWVPVPDTSEMFTTDAEGNTIGQAYDFGEYNSSTGVFEGKNPPQKLTLSDGFGEPIVLTETTCGDAVTGDSKRGIEQLKNVVGITGESDTAVLANWKIQLQDEFKSMKESVETYGGFYIGRYETGNLSQTTAAVKKENRDIEGQNWYVQYQKSKTIKENNSNVTTSMIWGCQWDATLRWMLSSENPEVVKYVTDSQGKGNYSGTQGDTDQIIPTGSNEAYQANNIYDMAGNVYDWTLEGNSLALRFRIIRGGDYQSPYYMRPVAKRHNEFSRSFKLADYDSAEAEQLYICRFYFYKKLSLFYLFFPHFYI